MFGALQFASDAFEQASADIAESAAMDTYFRRSPFGYKVRPSQTWKNSASVVWQRTSTGFRIASILHVGR